MFVPDPGGSRYCILSEIGSGGYGNVYKALDVVTGGVVALKKVKRFSSNVGIPQSFYRELSTLETLKGENLLGCQGVWKSDGEIYLVLDYCNYELGTLIRCGKEGIPVKYGKCFMKQILEGLNVMHSHGWMHLDVKPENIMVTANNTVKIGDFGLARREDLKERRLESVVTLAYRSPEVILKDPGCGSAVDIWSLACVFYEIATGRMLFGNGSTYSDSAFLESIFETCGTPNVEEWPNLRNLPKFEEVRRKDPRILESKLELLLDVTLPKEYKGLGDLIMQMLVYDPAKRITAERALTHPFFSDAEDRAALPQLAIPEMHGNSRVRPVFANVSRPRKRILRKEKVLPPPISVY